jgi:hypothetical protein
MTEQHGRSASAQLPLDRLAMATSATTAPSSPHARRDEIAPSAVLVAAQLVRKSARTVGGRQFESNDHQDTRRDKQPRSTTKNPIRQFWGPRSLVDLWYPRASWRRSVRG